MSRALAALTACLLATTVVAATPATLSTELPSTWQLNEMFADPAAWEAERQAIAAALPGLAKLKGTLGQSPAALRKVLDTESDLRRRLAKLGSYAGLLADEDMRATENQARRQLARNLSNDLQETAAFIDVEVIALGKTKLASFLKREPALAKYRYPLENTLRLAPHTLSQREEALLAAASKPLDAAQTTYGTLANADIPWPSVQIRGQDVLLDQAGYVAHRDDQDPAVRKLVFETFWSVFKTYERTFGSTYVGNLQATVFNAKARQHASSLNAALAPFNTPESVYRTLVAEANAGLPTLHRYFKLSKRVLGVPTLQYSDMYVPLAKPPRSYTLTEGAQLMLDALQPMGSDYLADLSRAVQSPWTHATVQRGKRSGAYMNGSVYDLHPYVLMSFNGSYDSVSTYAHEWGHGMHTILANRAQPYPTARYSLLVAEIPSTAHELLLADHAIRLAKTREEKIFALSQAIDQLRGTFFRQTMFAEFELATHEAIERGEALTGEKLSQLYLTLLRRYHGHDAGVMEIDARYGREWAYIPHFYNDFYVFQYATSISAAAYFTDGIGRGDTAVRTQFVKMLEAGGSNDPYLIVKAAGLDLATPAPYRALIKRMDGLLDQLEAVLNSPV